MRRKYRTLQLQASFLLQVDSLLLSSATLVPYQVQCVQWRLCLEVFPVALPFCQGHTHQLILFFLSCKY